MPRLKAIDETPTTPEEIRASPRLTALAGRRGEPAPFPVAIAAIQRYRDFAELSDDFAWETGPDGRFVFVAPGGALGWRAEELLGARPADYLVPDDLAAGEAGDEAALAVFSARAPRAGVELRFRAASGEARWLLAHCRPILSEDGVWRGARGICRDVTEARAREAELARLRHRERLLAYLVGTIRYEADPRSAAAAAALAALPALAAAGCRVHRQAEDGLSLVAECGAPAPSPEAEALAALAAAEGRVERAFDGHAVIAVPIRQGRRPAGALMLWRPIALGAWDAEDRFLVAELAGQLEVVLQQIASQETLANLSRTDPLTGLVNRRSFVGELEERLANAARKRPGALLYIDLDNFKQVNDRTGHAGGDAALVTFARLLRDCTRASDLVARLGGDEFAAWLEDIDEAAATAKAQALLARVEQELRPRSAAGEPPLGASIGIAPVTTGGGESATALIARADAAMYRAKRAGRQQFAVAG